MDPVTLAILTEAGKSGKSLVGQATGVAAAHAADFSKAGQATRRGLEADTKKMEAGKLGMSEAQRRQRALDAVRASQAGRDSSMAQMQQMAASMGPSRSGSMATAVRQASGADALAQAGAAQATNAESQALAEQRKAAIKAALERQYDRKRQDWQNAFANTQAAQKNAGGGMDFGNIAKALGSGGK